MPESEKDPAQQVEAARKAFESDFERFARFTVDSAERPRLSFAEAKGERRSLAELRTRHLGKKSAIASCRKLIAREIHARRALIGQLVERTETAFNLSVDKAEQALESFIEAVRTERESLDV